MSDGIQLIPYEKGVLIGEQYVSWETFSEMTQELKKYSKETESGHGHKYINEIISKSESIDRIHKIMELEDDCL